MTFRKLGLLLALALPLSLSACLEQACDLIFIPALNISVVDDQGDPIADATVTFNLNDGEAEGDCIEDLNGVYTCGGEGGDYLIRVEAEGFEASETMVTVGADACHPVTESPEIALAPAP